MKKKIKTTIWISILVIVLSIIAIYFFIAYRYQNTFQIGTWVNGVYCTGRSIEQVNQELLKQYSFPEIVIKDKEGAEYCFCASDFGVVADMTKELRKILAGQNSLLWAKEVDEFTSYEVEPEMHFTLNDQELKKTDLYQMSVVNESELFYIEKTESGYILVDHTNEVLDYERMKLAISNCLAEGRYVIDLYEENCYREYEKTAEMDEIGRLYQKIDRLQKFQITYLLGEDREILDAGIISDWIETDENGEIKTNVSGNPIVNAQKITEYIHWLSGEYDTYEKARNYHTTRGDDVLIELSNYGNLMDQESEINYLTEVFHNYENGLTDISEYERTPDYLEKALYQGKNDIGPDYIEVDMTAQTLYMYIDNEIYIETPIVTGNLKWNLGTPEMICFVYAKLRDRTLRGPGYESFVNYWCPIYKNIGLHDANWRKKSEFGGETYKTKGSHGCINIMPSVMPDIYEKIFKGMPVILYY